MNPHEPGMVESDGFHAQLVRDLANSVSELTARQDRSSFFNPMWELWGDAASTRAAGSYYFADAGRSSNHFWQIYDQILLRPKLMRGLQEIRILHSTGRESLVTQGGRPAKAAYSDHLPVLCRLAV